MRWGSFSLDPEAVLVAGAVLVAALVMAMIVTNSAHSYEQKALEAVLSVHAPGCEQGVE